ncbi:hypothetical protein A9Q78_10280 [Methylophaga sp. 41_12_T18]|nr:hypothetical protein A9Q78_10280 [Methylophaga sp. 41_12_T18]
MNSSLLWLMMSASMLVLTAAQAEQSCPIDDQQGQSQCQQPEWRQQAAMSDNSQLRYSDVAENTEQVLPRSTVTLWALPPVPTVSNTVYSADEMQAVQLKVTTPSPQFSSAKATVDGEIVKRVASLVEQLKDKTGVRLHITGHTDSQSLSVQTQRWFKDNQTLSEARAQAVADYFQQTLGLSAGAITVSGKGASQPVANNSTPTGMTKNRRVDVAIWYNQVTAGKATTITTPTMNRQQICGGELQSIAPVAGGFRISVDGQAVDGGQQDGEDIQRCTDVALAKTDIRLQYDNLSVKPMLNGSAWPATAQSGELITFQAYSNYLAWLERAEVRIFSAARSVESQPLTVIALDDAMQGEWTVSADAPRNMQYVVRVYDAQGRYDQTTALPLSKVVEHNVPADDQIADSQNRWLAYGNNRLEQQNIAISGGSITVHGENVPAQHQVVLMGQTIPVDDKGKFVSQQVIPHGQHTIEVAALNAQGDGELFWRDVELKTEDWFYVGIIDVTAGRYHANAAALEVSQDRHLDNSSFVDGRLAFYTKGKWRDKYTVTASADTREQEFSQLFSTIMDKDPRSLLRRLDDTAYYPTYGDDSTLVEDAPTQGKFYAKIEDERSHATWGNFKIVQQETDLAQINRGLYGAVIDWNSESFTSNNDSKTQLNVFAAEPGTQASHEEFRGTGGSLYYLQNQDIVTGSERVQVEVRDKDSGIVLSVNSLVAGQDYQEDAVQGRIVLTRPLPSTADDSQLVRAGNYAGHPVYLVVNYEYVGTMTDFSDLAVGGRATHWLNDNVRLGVTSSHQQTANNDQNLNGFDVLFSKTPETYLRLEAATTKGPGVSSNGSLDGGFTFASTASTVDNDKSANAYQIESGFRLSDVGFDNDGNGHFYMRRRQDGFSAPGQLVSYDTNQYGGGISLPLTEHDSVNVKLDITQQNQGIDTEAAEVDWRHRLNQDWSVAAGLRADSREDNGNIATTNNDGDRTDLSVQVDYGLDQDWGLYGFGQGTLNHTGDRNKNNRAGIGGHYQVNDRLGLKGEASNGNGGFGALVGTDYRLSDRTTTYLNYALNPDNANSGIGNRQGKLVSGLRNRYSDWVSVYGEEQYLHGSSGEGLTHAYGVDLTPNESWKFGLAMESGELETDSSIIKRRGASLAVNYAKQAIKYGGNLEFRRDEVDDVRRDNWLTRNHLAYQLNPDWRMNLRLDLAFSDSDAGNFLDADYVETVFGYAYRPVNNDKFNALLEYKYLADQAPSDQFTSTGQQNEYQQRSHVFAVDAIYDLTPRWSIGAKYAVRVGELRAGRGEGDWFKSTSQLVIGRLDWHVVKHWDGLLELRALDVREAEDTRAGALVAVYRHISDHVKAGVGYNFTDFSDDLTDLDYDSRGMFFNIIGKW